MNSRNARYRSTANQQVQRQPSVRLYQPYPQNYPPANPGCPPSMNFYSAQSFAPSYQNFRFVNGNIYPSIPYRPPSLTTSHRNEFSNNHRYLNPQHRQIRPHQAMRFFCKSCDREFTTKEKYDEHVAEHITCNRDGCTFAAHPKIVDNHIIMQHNTGVFKRIVQGNDPEEIKRWIDERKKQYPTSKKTEEDQRQKEAMNKRGERYNGKDQKRTLRSHIRNSAGHRNHMNRKGEKSNFRGRPNIPNLRSRPINEHDGHIKERSRKQHTEKTIDDDFQRNLPRFLGTAHFDDSIILDEISSVHDRLSSTSNNVSIIEIGPSQNFFFNEADCDSSDDNKETTNSPPTKLSKTNPSPPCSSHPASVSKSSSLNLIQCYSSSDSDDNEERLSKTNVVKTAEEDIRVEYVKKINKAMPKFGKTNIEVLPVNDDERKHNETNIGLETVEDDNSEPEEQSSKMPEQLESDSSITVLSSDMKPSSSNGNEKRTRKHKRCKDEQKRESPGLASKLTEYPTYKRYRKPTLLEKLLAPEIRHERNVILQCVRYVVENEFFDLNKS